VCASLSPRGCATLWWLASIMYVFSSYFGNLIVFLANSSSVIGDRDSRYYVCILWPSLLIVSAVVQVTSTCTYFYSGWRNIKPGIDRARSFALGSFLLFPLAFARSISLNRSCYNSRCLLIVSGPRSRKLKQISTDINRLAYCCRRRTRNSGHIPKFAFFLGCVYRLGSGGRAFPIILDALLLIKE